jgi:hypothetical protein
MTKTPKIEIVLELTRDEALGTLKLVGGTYGLTGFQLYTELWQALVGHDHVTVADEANVAYPTMFARGQFGSYET